MMGLPKGYKHVHYEGQKDCPYCFEQKELREYIATEIEKLINGLEPKNDFIRQYAPVDLKEIIWRAAEIARGA
jgi:hypothetical protein